MQKQMTTFLGALCRLVWELDVTGTDELVRRPAALPAA